MEDPYASFPARALPLVSIVESEESANGWRVETHSEALEVLGKVDDKVIVVAIAGQYRTGKSSLLNWLVQGLDEPRRRRRSSESALQSADSVDDADEEQKEEDEERASRQQQRKKNGTRDSFGVGHEVERCTKGVWVWGRPRRVVLKDGSFAAVLALDTEGLGGLADVDGAYDATLFTLTSLLCSTLLYNSPGSLDERALANLGLAANLSRQIVATSHDEDDEESSSSTQQPWTPRLVWVLRDFALELVDEDGSEITANEYLELALDVGRVRAHAGNEAAATRRAVTSFFPERECWTLPQPFSSSSSRSFRPEFLEAFRAFRAALFSEQTSLKRIAGAPATGRALAKLVAEYAKLFSSPAGLPELSSAWRRVVLDELSDLARRANDAHAEALLRAASLEDDRKKVCSLALAMARVAAAHASSCRSGEDLLRGDLVLSQKRAFQDAVLALRRDCDARFEATLGDLRRRASAATKKRIDDVRSRLLAPALEATTTDTLVFSSSSADVAKGGFEGLEDAGHKVETYAGLVAEAAFGDVENYDDAASKALKFAVQASTRAATAVASARDDKRDATLALYEQKVAEAERDLAFVRGKDAARNEQFEDARRDAHALKKDLLQLKARFDAQEAVLEKERQRGQDLQLAVEAAKDELADSARALEAEHKWQVQLQERLDLRVQLAKEREEDLANRLARAHKSISINKIRANDRLRPQSSRCGGYTVLDFLLDDTDAAANKLDVNTEELERFCLDIDLVTVLPSLKKLGASSVQDLIFLEPKDLDDFPDLDDVQKRSLLDAVQTAKAHYDANKDKYDPLTASSQAAGGRCLIS